MVHNYMPHPPVPPSPMEAEILTSLPWCAPPRRRSLRAMALAMPTLREPHVNAQAFRGVLCRLDEASDRPPGGAEGHAVRIATAVAEAALPTLLGMAVDVDRTLRDHDKTHKVGMVTEAYCQGKDLIIGGHLFSKDFPGLVATLQARQADLGFSYEISGVAIRDTSAPIWDLEELTFTGCCILEKRAAAYERTSLRL
jgi:hypothetical protein